MNSSTKDPGTRTRLRGYPSGSFIGRRIVLLGSQWVELCLMRRWKEEGRNSSQSFSLSSSTHSPLSHHHHHHHPFLPFLHRASFAQHFISCSEFSLLSHSIHTSSRSHHLRQVYLWESEKDIYFEWTLQVLTSFPRLLFPDLLNKCRLFLSHLHLKKFKFL